VCSAGVGCAQLGPVSLHAWWGGSVCGSGSRVCACCFAGLNPFARLSAIRSRCTPCWCIRRRLSLILSLSLSPHHAS
jgi:hypothetical protein